MLQKKVYAPVTHPRTDAFAGLLYPVKKLPFVPGDKAKRTERCLSIFEMQVAGLVKRMSVAAQNVVVGVSGGLDSTLALLVCVQAMKQTSQTCYECHRYYNAVLWHNEQNIQQFCFANENAWRHI